MCIHNPMERHQQIYSSWFHTYSQRRVLIVGDEKNRGDWKKGEVLCLILDRDVVVRGVVLLHKGHTMEHPLQLVCPFEIRAVIYAVPLQERRKDEAEPRNKRV